MRGCSLQRTADNCPGTADNAASIDVGAVAVVVEALAPDLAVRFELWDGSAIGVSDHGNSRLAITRIRVE